MGRDAGSVVRGREAAWGWYVVWFDDLYNVFYKVKSPLSVLAGSGLLLAAGDAMSVVVLIFADGIRSSWRTRRRDAVSHTVKLLRYGAGLSNQLGIVTAVDAQAIRRRHNQADRVGLNLNRLLECTGVLQQMPGMEMMLLRLF